MTICRNLYHDTLPPTITTTAKRIAKGHILPYQRRSFALLKTAFQIIRNLNHLACNPSKISPAYKQTSTSKTCMLTNSPTHE